MPDTAKYLRAINVFKRLNQLAPEGYHFEIDILQDGELYLDCVLFDSVQRLHHPLDVSAMDEPDSVPEEAYGVVANFQLYADEMAYDVDADACEMFGLVCAIAFCKESGQDSTELEQQLRALEQGTGKTAEDDVGLYLNYDDAHFDEKLSYVIKKLIEVYRQEQS